MFCVHAGAKKGILLFNSFNLNVFGWTIKLFCNHFFV